MDQELGKLLAFVGEVAIAIRMNSAYNGLSRDNPNTAYDVMWLSDALHNFGMLGDAIADGNRGRIVEACDMLTHMFEWYMQPAQGGLKSPPRETFARWERHVRLEDAISVFSAIKRKTFEA